jgi:hypothetical protein
MVWNGAAIARVESLPDALIVLEQSWVLLDMQSRGAGEMGA